MTITHRSMLCALVALGLLAGCEAEPPDPPARPAPAGPLRIAIMDPLALPLACACVEGYGQRRYEWLAKSLRCARIWSAHCWRISEPPAPCS